MCICVNGDFLSNGLFIIKKKQESIAIHIAICVRHKCMCVCECEKWHYGMQSITFNSREHFMRIRSTVWHSITNRCISHHIQCTFHVLAFWTVFFLFFNYLNSIDRKRDQKKSGLNAFIKFPFDLTMILLLIIIFCCKNWKYSEKKRKTKMMMTL